MSHFYNTPRAIRCTLARMETKTYEGGCHCGAVQYEVTIEPPTKAYNCNCSICSRAGWLLRSRPTLRSSSLPDETRSPITIRKEDDAPINFAKRAAYDLFPTGADQTGKAVGCGEFAAV